METKPPLPPFTQDSAIQKVRMAEDAWNTRDPDRVVLVYTEDTRWRNRAEFPVGRERVREFLIRKWAKELDYRLIKELWACSGNRIAVRFAYEWHDDSGQWFRSYGNENWAFNDQGFMVQRYASINDLPIKESERKFFWPLGVAHERQEQKTQQGKLLRVSELSETDHHIRVPLGGLGFVSPEQTVPPGDTEAVIAVRFSDDDRVVNPVHVRRHHDAPKQPVHSLRKMDVAVIEHGQGVENHLEDHHCQSRCAERGHGRQLENHGYENFDGVEPQTGGHIQVKIRVMHHVQPPERGDGVMQDVLRIHHEVQNGHGHDHLEPIGQGYLVEQPPIPLGGKQGQPHGKNGKNHRHGQRVQSHDGQVGEPTPGFGGPQPPSRDVNLRHRQNGENAEKGAEANDGFSFHIESFHQKKHLIFKN